jgi:hypothetical protein
MKKKKKEKKERENCLKLLDPCAFLPNIISSLPLSRGTLYSEFCI